MANKRDRDRFDEQLIQQYFELRGGLCDERRGQHAGQR